MTGRRQQNHFCPERQAVPLEELEQPKVWQAKIAAIDPADEEAMAVEPYALHGDEEGDAVRDHARREEEAAAVDHHRRDQSPRRRELEWSK